MSPIDCRKQSLGFSIYMATATAKTPSTGPKIDGVRIEHNAGLTIIFIEDFSAKLQALIRKHLTEIYHGYAEVKESSRFYSYKNTLKSFLDRYEEKTPDTQKGMIAELLAHVLINSLSQKFISLSVLKNKEERSIKKGFDIVYYHSHHKNIWYAEIKSGEGSASASNADSDNLELLKRSKESILKMFSSGRNSLWESAMIDVMLVVEAKGSRLRMKDLLSKDSASMTKSNKKRNTILISVLYKPLTQRVSHSVVASFHDSVVAEKVFNDTIVISIQKATYAKVAKFLKIESK